MKRALGLLFLASTVVTGSAAEQQAPAPRRLLDTAQIERLTGASGSFDEKEGVFKVSVPRTDLAVSVGGVKLTPPMGLTSWASFMSAHGKTMVMGDMVLLEDQVNPVMSVALDHGLDVTALHNHFLGDSPRVMFMHIGGNGDQADLARAVGAVFKEIREPARPRGSDLAAGIDPAASSLDPKKIEDILGQKGKLANGVYKVTIGRTTRMHGQEVGATMGVNTWAVFAGSDDRAVVDGDFAMLESELQGVLKSLRGAGIDIVAIHNHMTSDSPRMVFLHYWAIGPTTQLARGLRAALDLTVQAAR